VKEGNILPMMDSDGNRLNGSVMEIKDDLVVLDFNHPLAGETLHFEGKVIDVHDPTEEEIASITSNGCDCDDNNRDCSCCHSCN
jgi:FKBP-type peptidyl-prolyl cis-trans isomerase SlyD